VRGGAVVVVIVVVVADVVVIDTVVVVLEPVVVVPVVPVVVSNLDAGAPANAYAARTPARAQATSTETLRPRFIVVLAKSGRSGSPANPPES
jgi:hypothetical protein